MYVDLLLERYDLARDDLDVRFRACRLSAADLAEELAALDDEIEVEHRAMCDAEDAGV
jgi:hypothetical protein